MRILIVDVGGTHVKVAGSWNRVPEELDSGPTMTAVQMVQQVKALAHDWNYDVVSIGYPGPVRNGKPAKEPHNLGGGWKGMDFEQAFGKPVRLVNDAAMQALGSYEHGRMLFLGLGTGLGTAIVSQGQLEPLELAHLPYRKDRSYEEYVGDAGRKRLGRKRWEHHVATVSALLQEALLCDYVVLGGGNVTKIATLPAHCRRGSNEHAIDGGVRLWDSSSLPLAIGKA